MFSLYRNHSPTEASTDAELKRVKLCYTTPELDNKDAIQEWNTLLTSHDSLSDDELRMKVMKGKFKSMHVQ